MDSEKLLQLVDQISKRFFGKPFIDKVCFNNRLRTTGGRYIPKHRTIELNPKYLDELEEEEFIGIIKHELCHYHLHIEGKGYKHADNDFKKLLAQTNSPRYCQPLPSTKENKKHVYQCSQCGILYRRVRKINVSKYRCGKCKGRLKKI